MSVSVLYSGMNCIRKYVFRVHHRIPDSRVVMKDLPSVLRVPGDVQRHLVHWFLGNFQFRTDISNSILPWVTAISLHDQFIPHEIDELCLPRILALCLLCWHWFISHNGGSLTSTGSYLYFLLLLRRILLSAWIVCFISIFVTILIILVIALLFRVRCKTLQVLEILSSLLLRLALIRIRSDDDGEFSLDWTFLKNPWGKGI